MFSSLQLPAIPILILQLASMVDYQWMLYFNSLPQRKILIRLTLYEGPSPIPSWSNLQTLVQPKSRSSRKIRSSIQAKVTQFLALGSIFLIPKHRYIRHAYDIKENWVVFQYKAFGLNLTPWHFNVPY